jgi:hypothetical protein
MENRIIVGIQRLEIGPALQTILVLELHATMTRSDKLAHY